MKANNDYEVSKQVAKLRKVVERDKEFRFDESVFNEPEVVEPELRLASRFL